MSIFKSQFSGDQKTAENPLENELLLPLLKNAHSFYAAKMSDPAAFNANISAFLSPEGKLISELYDNLKSKEVPKNKSERADFFDMLGLCYASFLKLSREDGFASYSKQADEIMKAYGSNAEFLSGATACRNFFEVLQQSVVPEKGGSALSFENVKAIALALGRIGNLSDPLERETVRLEMSKGEAEYLSQILPRLEGAVFSPKIKIEPSTEFKDEPVTVTFTGTQAPGKKSAALEMAGAGEVQLPSYLRTDIPLSERTIIAAYSPPAEAGYSGVAALLDKELIQESTVQIRVSVSTVQPRAHADFYNPKLDKIIDPTKLSIKDAISDLYSRIPSDGSRALSAKKELADMLATPEGQAFGALIVGLVNDGSFKIPTSATCEYVDNFQDYRKQLMVAVGQGRNVAGVLKDAFREAGFGEVNFEKAIVPCIVPFIELGDRRASLQNDLEQVLAKEGISKSALYLPSDEQIRKFRQDIFWAMKSADEKLYNKFISAGALKEARGKDGTTSVEVNNVSTLNSMISLARYLGESNKKSLDVHIPNENFDKYSSKRGQMEYMSAGLFNQCIELPGGFNIPTRGYAFSLDLVLNISYKIGKPPASVIPGGVVKVPYEVRYWASVVDKDEQKTDYNMRYSGQLNTRLFRADLGTFFEGSQPPQATSSLLGKKNALLPDFVKTIPLAGNSGTFTFTADRMSVLPGYGKRYAYTLVTDAQNNREKPTIGSDILGIRSYAQVVNLDNPLKVPQPSSWKPQSNVYNIANLVSPIKEYPLKVPNLGVSSNFTESNKLFSYLTPVYAKLNAPPNYDYNTFTIPESTTPQQVEAFYQSLAPAITKWALESKSLIISEGNMLPIQGKTPDQVFDLFITALGKGNYSDAQAYLDPKSKMYLALSEWIDPKAVVTVKAKMDFVEFMRYVDRILSTTASVQIDLKKPVHLGNAYAKEVGKDRYQPDTEANYVEFEGEDKQVHKIAFSEKGMAKIKALKRDEDIVLEGEDGKNYFIHASREKTSKDLVLDIFSVPKVSKTLYVYGKYNNTALVTDQIAHDAVVGGQLLFTFKLGKKFTLSPFIDASLNIPVGSTSKGAYEESFGQNIVVNLGTGVTAAARLNRFVGLLGQVSIHNAIDSGGYKSTQQGAGTVGLNLGVPFNGGKGGQIDITCAYSKFFDLAHMQKSLNVPSLRINYSLMKSKFGFEVGAESYLFPKTTSPVDGSANKPYQVGFNLGFKF